MILLQVVGPKEKEKITEDNMDQADNETRNKNQDVLSEKKHRTGIQTRYQPLKRSYAKMYPKQKKRKCGTQFLLSCGPNRYLWFPFPNDGELRHKDGSDCIWWNADR